MTPGRLTYYALAVLLSGLALALTLLLEPLMERSIFLLFIAAIVVSALYGGLGPGLVAVFLSTSASGLFFVPPRYTLLVGLEHLVRLGVFLLVMTAITWLAARRTHVEEGLRESEERFRATFEQAAVGIAHVAQDGSWVRVNDRLCEIVGYEREELLEITFQDITHPDDLDADLEQARQLLDGQIETYSMEKRYLKKDGSVVWINLTGSLVREAAGEPAYYIAVVEDISERKRAEEALRSVREAERNRMARDLHDGVLQDLSYTTAALGLIMLRTEDRELHRQLQKAVDVVRRAAQELRDAVNDLRLEGEADRPFPEIVASLVERIRAMDPEHDIRLEVRDGFPWVSLGDAGVEISRVIREALTNARRHSGATRVRVRLWTEDGYLVAEVGDDGRGFGPEHEAGGGSKSMRERALRLSGELEVESKPGEGTRVRVRAPMAAALRGSGPPDSGEARSDGRSASSEPRG